VKVPLLMQIIAAGLPEPVTEYQFSPDRGWRFDYAWLPQKVAVEIDGGTWTQGRHTRGPGVEEDCRKMAHALALGWWVLRVTTRQVESGEALAWLEVLLKEEAA
jgi:very-short-patch-repair endonuclease